jgi:hypothetical protein
MMKPTAKSTGRNQTTQKKMKKLASKMTAGIRDLEAAPAMKRGAKSKPKFLGMK